MKTALKRMKFKMDSPLGLIIHKINKIIFGKIKANDIIFAKHGSQLKKKHFKNGIWDFKDAKLPYYNYKFNDGLMYLVYLDTFFIYCNFNDNYNSHIIDKIDDVLPEGPYGYKNELVDVTISKNDIVIDAGAWIGDFSAYASCKGAIVYSFEPSNETFQYLKKTQELNSNITIVKKALGDKCGISFLSSNLDVSFSYHITTDHKDSEKIEITTLDKFVEENCISKIDFIKADIEGYERYLLRGAKKVLKEFGPKLAICTYHLPDDPEVLSEIILDANPNYKIIKKKHKLYAMVIE